MQLKYVGRSDSHSISKEQFSDAGVNQSAVVFDASSGFTAEVSAAAGKLLLERHPDEFTEVSKETKEDTK